MNTILLGNAISLLGAVIMVCVGFVKRKKYILSIQCAQFALLGTANLILGGVSGFFSNMISIVRNIVADRYKLTLPWKAGFVFVQGVLTVLFNTNGLVGWIPFINVALYTWILDKTDEVVIKAVIIITQFLWIFFDLTIHNYTSVTFDVLTIITNAAGIIMLKKERARKT